MRVHTGSCCAHSSANSDNAASRARASSPRLVSWVAVASIACGQCCSALLIGTMECAHGAAEALGIPADFVHRDETVIAVERRVFDALGDHRPAVLLQPHRAAQQRLAREAAARLAHQVAR